MDRPALIDTLASITGSWSASEAHAADLKEARHIIASSLAAGTPADQIHPAAASMARLTQPTPAARPAIEMLVSALPPIAAPAVRPFVRSALDLDPVLRESIAGMKVERTLGPFVDQLGI